jgi:dipeptidyl-peptidase 4
MRSYRIAALVTLASASLGAQGRTVTTADYDRARAMLAPALNGLVVGGAVAPTWAPDGRFWYRNTTLAGTEIVVIDPAAKTRKSCASTATDCEGLAISAGGGGGRGGRGGGGGRAGGGGRGGAAAKGEPLSMSPDGKKGVFVRDWNLWVHDAASGTEKQLTRDGTKWNGYATDNAGWASTDRAMVQWSPDSRRVATQQQDERNVGEMYLVNTTVGHPNLTVQKMPLPGDTAMAMLTRVIVDVDAGTTTKLQMPVDFHRGSIGDNIRMEDYQWNDDGSKLAIVSSSRDHKKVWLSVADASTGAVRKVYEETVPTHFEAHVAAHILWSTNEFIWNSERDNFSQLYLYDLSSGTLKNKVTSGDGPVLSVAKFDDAKRTATFMAEGKEAGEDPYFPHAYRVNYDGKGFVSLTPDVGAHAAQFSPDQKYLVDTYSQPDVPPVVVLRDGATGKTIMPLEKADISKLVATGWKPPVPIKMVAHDGKTAIYGLMFPPTHMVAGQKYPIINNIYPGPQSGSTGARTFSAARGDRQALAELGFVLVTIDGMGTPGRSKSFEDAYYGAMGRDNTIPDQITGMKQLAQKYPYIDIDKAGIWGHSGGGFGTTSAMFRYPDFFKVGIAESGNHDQRLYEDDWGERYQGLLVKGADGTDGSSNYDAEANENFAKNLKGHLLLAHGSVDNNVPSAETMVVVDALIKANKEFDMVIIPNVPHGYGAASDWMMRKRWDYFVRWLAGNTPPFWNQ